MPDPSPATHDEATADALREPPRTLPGMLRQIGPGVIIAGAIVGSGELIATTKVGAEAGFWLLWLIVVGCVIKVFTQVEFGRYAVTWGRTALGALDEVPGPRLRVNWIVWYWAVVTVLIIAQQGGIVGGVGQALAISRPLTEQGVTYNAAQDALTRARVDLALARAEGSEATATAAQAREVERLTVAADAVAEPLDAYLWAALLAVLTSVLLYVGRYGLIQAVATALVAIFTVVTVVTVVLLQQTAWAVTGADVARGFRFALPPAEAAGTPVATALAAFGIIGLGAFELIMYPYWCLEKGYARFTGPREASPAWARRARGWMRVLHVDAWGALLVYTFATVAFYLLGAAVLAPSGLNPAGAGMIRTLGEMYVPVFGAWAEPVFLFGAVAVLYSTFFVAAAGNARLVADGLGLFGLTDGTEHARRVWTRRISAAWPLVALVIYLFVRAPVAMVLAGGIAQSVMLPMLGGAALYFRYRRLDERLRPGRTWDALLWLSAAGLLVIGLWSVASLLV